MEQRRVAFVWDNGIATTKRQAADIQSAINRALYQEKVPRCARVQRESLDVTRRHQCWRVGVLATALAIGRAAGQSRFRSDG